MLINEKRVWIEKELTDRDSVFNFIAKELYAQKIITDEKLLVDKLIARENEVSTGFEQGIAIPHAKLSGVKEPLVCVVKTGDINWPSMDKMPTNFIIAIIVPENGAAEHFKILSQLTRKIVKDDFRNALLNGDKKEIVELVNQVQIDEETEVKKESESSDDFYVAVTKCPVGIAHTFMAAENIEKAAKKMGVNVKVEAQGSAGTENKLTNEDIKNAKGVIIAADVAIDEKSRFNGKKVLEVKIKSALNDAESLFEKANEADIMNVLNSEQSEQPETGSVVKYLLNGVSHMIPFVVVGGLFIALALSFGGEVVNGEIVIPESSFWYTINQIGAVGFYLMIPILAGFIAFAIAGRAALAPAMITAVVANSPEILGTDAGTGFLGALIVGLLAGYIVRWINTWKIPKEIRPIMPIFVIPLGVTLVLSVGFVYILGYPISLLMTGLTDFLNFLSTNEYLKVFLGMVLGAMIAFDMGGPVNKVAFLFGVASITAGNPEVMGAVAAAIAVPPLSAGVATFIAKKKFNEEEKSTGIAAILMGLIGITEGAIPFAAAQPKIMIPSFMVGSMVASTMALLFNITDVVPHGGPIVGLLGATNNILLYFLCIIVGTIVSALLIAKFRKTIQ